MLYFTLKRKITKRNVALIMYTLYLHSMNIRIYYVHLFIVTISHKAIEACIFSASI